MTSPDKPNDFIHDLRRRNETGNGVIQVADNVLGIFEPELARRVTRANWRHYAMPGRPLDVLRNRRSPQMLWSSVRAAWMTQLHKLTTGACNEAMMARMQRVLETDLDSGVDLVMLSQRVSTEAILPVILSGLTPAEDRWIRQDLDQKLMRLVALRPFHRPSDHLRFWAAQVRAGLVIRTVMRQRSTGRRPRELDVADPFVDMLPQLGLTRTTDVVSTMLTAIGGPPGSAAASTLYELARQRRWAGRLAEELSGVGQAEFLAAPTKTAPLTYRFVKEVLRMWSPPLLLVRHARIAYDLGVAQLSEGDGYMVSPHLIHRNARYWPQPDTFDPDRFLPGAPNGNHQRGHYVPFGWEPKKCPGADIATIHLMVLCYLMCTRYRLEVPDIDDIEIALRFAPIPQQFHGRIQPR